MNEKLQLENDIITGFNNLPRVKISELEFKKYILPVITGQLKPHPNFLLYIKSLDKENLDEVNTLGALNKEIDVVDRRGKVIGTLPPFKNTSNIDGIKDSSNKTIISALKQFKERSEFFPSQSLNDNIVKSIDNGVKSSFINNKIIDSNEEKLLKLINVYYPNFTFENKNFSLEKEEDNKKIHMEEKVKTIVEELPDPDIGIEWE